MKILLKHAGEVPADRVLGRLIPPLKSLAPDAEVHHIGATAIPGAITRGDVDVLLRVSSARFPLVVTALKQCFQVKQTVNWTATFASFGDDTGFGLPVGIQVVVKDSENDFLLFLRDYLIEHPKALAEYNRLKMANADKSPETYWKAKNEFLQGILAARQK